MVECGSMNQEVSCPIPGRGISPSCKLNSGRWGRGWGGSKGVEGLQDMQEEASANGCFSSMFLLSPSLSNQSNKKDLTKECV